MCVTWVSPSCQDVRSDLRPDPCYLWPKSKGTDSLTQLCFGGPISKPQETSIFASELGRGTKALKLPSAPGQITELV